MGGFIRVWLLNQVADNLDPRQYAREGHSTTDALVYLLQAVHEATDSGNCGARILFTDFTKGFDLIDYNILVLELTNIGVHPVLINWIKSFLYNRRQAVRIGNSFSQWRSPNGGFPQGTKRANTDGNSSVIDMMDLCSFFNRFYSFATCWLVFQVFLSQNTLRSTQMLT